MIHFTTETMIQIMADLKSQLATEGSVSFAVLDPDLCQGRYAGETLEVEGRMYRCHSYKSWSDLAELLKCRMMTPKQLAGPLIELTFRALREQESFHTAATSAKEEKYGTDSPFYTIQKNEEPSFIHAYHEALKLADIASRQRVLNLGVNRADEFEVIQTVVGDEAFNGMELTGIDHSQSAIEAAQERFPKHTFFAHDINEIDTLQLQPFDLIISIGTLQSPGINFKPFFNHLIQHYLKKEGAVILGFPNCRWVDGEMLYGAKMKNYSEPDLSLLIKDIHYCKKYLQQKRFNVRIGGKNYLFLTATKSDS